MKNDVSKYLEISTNQALRKLKILDQKNIYLTSNLSKLGRLKLSKIKKLDIIFSQITKCMGKNYSIFSPAATMNLCNTNEIFYPESTPSNKMGPLAEYIRKKNSVRSLHPFWSVSCIGKNKKILKSISPHSYGVGSAWSKMLDLDTMQLNIGINPERAVTLIHHIETIVGVPYRYNKEFIHKIFINNKVQEKKFYLSVRFKNLKIEKRNKLNSHYFNELKKRKQLNYFKSTSGLEFWSFKMRDFFNVAVKMFEKDIYNYLEKPLDINLDI